MGTSQSTVTRESIDTSPKSPLISPASPPPESQQQPHLPNPGLDPSASLSALINENTQHSIRLQEAIQRIRHASHTVSADDFNNLLAAHLSHVNNHKNLLDIMLQFSEEKEGKRSPLASTVYKLRSNVMDMMGTARQVAHFEASLSTGRPVASEHAEQDEKTNKRELSPVFGGPEIFGCDENLLSRKRIRSNWFNGSTMSCEFEAYPPTVGTDGPASSSRFMDISAEVEARLASKRTRMDAELQAQLEANARASLEAELRYKTLHAERKKRAQQVPPEATFNITGKRKYRSPLPKLCSEAGNDPFELDLESSDDQFPQTSNTRQAGLGNAQEGSSMGNNTKRTSATWCHGHTTSDSESDSGSDDDNRSQRHSKRRRTSKGSLHQARLSRSVGRKRVSSETESNNEQNNGEAVKKAKLIFDKYDHGHGHLPATGKREAGAGPGQNSSPSSMADTLLEQTAKKAKLQS
ncbi:hypothetical protein K402DRAFT_467417 [Aulographum hederae CBS 113979]|uniref:Uncharacterized protein n=1 Tax=Aulographum hederae CBS 113979 TaxID=1176131 RepID=A0A6G1GLN4_9PEZI|nr:hypothetical protein K402DRAFT_467417 [Aulographum hederae CBS 113979]